jgi:hypothetical protein
VSSFRSALFTDLVEELRVPDSKVARSYAALTRPTCRASITAFTIWANFLCPAIEQRYHNNAADETQKQVEQHQHNTHTHAHTRTQHHKQR